MQVQVDISFDQLVEAVKALPKSQLTRLREEIEASSKEESSTRSDLEKLLLNGPTATKKQLETIEKNRKAINQWREKH
ncbi:hypothetical protein [Dyadobacter sp.]|uniref:hypothetical protein n=1 Tax=Dyadobacter sp. TaxID=1914288 RepID=UPI003F6E80BA